MNEAQTELEYIDPALKEVGWGVVEGSKIRKQHPISEGRLLGQGRRSKPLKADYVLQYKNRYLAVVEAKANDVFYTEGVGQAKDYANRLNIRYTYSTNGLRIYQIDMETGKECDVDKFPSPDELWNMTFPPVVSEKDIDSDNWKERFFSVPFEDKSGTWILRYYQDNAVTRVLESIAEGKNRILLTLATGTGKTAIAFQIAWKLFHSRWNINRDGQRTPRILFLADRNILADQAFNSFNAFEDDALVRIKPSEISKKGKVPKNGSVFFTIFQSFMSGPEETPHFGQYPKDYFDFIIIDECHRGGARDESSWRKIMEYFSPAVQLGLTATPKRDVNIDTYKYFGKPVYEYSLKEGINDGFLTPFRVKEINTTIDKYTYEPDDDVQSGEIDEAKEYTEADFNKIIEIKEREDFRVKLFMSMIDQNQKTLVFCATQLHAAAVRDLINQVKKSDNPNYCQRVTANDGSLGEQYLRDFQDNEKTIPTILTTSYKLSTGVDAPEVRNIVLLRSVNSMVEFKQIVGRGTRLFEGKDYYTIYDFVNAHNHFKDPAWDGPPLDPPPYFPPKLKDSSANESKSGYCSGCNNDPCVCEKPSKQMIKVKLADKKVLEFDSMIKTSFWNTDGKPISADQFIKTLFGDIPSFFKNEDELRKIWSLPDTRKKLLRELSDKGYTTAQLDDLQKIVHGEESDLYDVLSYVAYHKELVPRLERAAIAKVYLNNYNPAQQEFLNYVLDQYVSTGVSELDDEKLGDLLVLKYKALHDAKEKLGDIGSIRDTFIKFQKHLYEHRVG